jgi:hypothetical protein
MFHGKRSLRDVGDRFELGGFSLERCGRQVRVGRVFVREIQETGSEQDIFHSRDVGCSFRLVSDRYQKTTLQNLRKDAFVNGEMWVKGSDRESCQWRYVGNRFKLGRLLLARCE